MLTKEEKFAERYAQLNERQKEAVDTIYGAVMVIAGPGTGKTEVLAMRIAALLRSEVQVQPYEVLCLTYTDEATNSMRKRLVQIIGTEAHRINIFTFHAFCNHIIQNNPYYFKNNSRAEMQPLSDLERTDMLYKLLDGLSPGHKLRKLSGNIYSDSAKLSRLFDFMRKENLSPEVISVAIDSYLEELPTKEAYIYKRNGSNFKKGDVKKGEIEKESQRLDTTRAAAFLYDDYRRMMAEAGRYDFNDMILWVIEAFKEDQVLLQSYQERYQFILVDEFQDTNGSQNELIHLLTSYWEDPNIFVVGDDDQGIYEFQGARIRNIIDFYERFKAHIRIIVLPENYRSSQAILDSAMISIGNNKQRLINQLQSLELNKTIVSAHKRFANGKETIKPVVREYEHVMQEEADILCQIEAIQKQHVPLNNIAIIYAQHKQAESLMKLMERKGIAYNSRKTVDVLNEPVIIQILNILGYLDAERKKVFDGEEMLFELLHAPYFGISAADIARVALYLQANKKDKSPLRWKLILSNLLLFESLELRSAKAMHRLGEKLDQWESQQLDLPLPLLVERIVYESGIVAHMVQTADHVWKLQVLRAFFEFVKETALRHPRVRPAEFLDMVDRMRSENIPVPVERVIQSENGVYFYTAHSSKGNEFEYVFLLGCTKNFWEDKKGGNNEYKLPGNLTATETDAEESYKTEVARRLFYVAMTRAKKHLQISYAQRENSGKLLYPSLFVDEISQEEDRIKTKVGTDVLTDQIIAWLEPVKDVRIKMANGEWVDKALQQFTMSYTSLSKYLHCPVTFYYENILRAPFQKNDALAFGSAVHSALERLFLEMKARKGTFPDKEQFLEYFGKALNAEASSFTRQQFERRKEQGLEALAQYYDHYVGQFHKEVEIEFNIPRYILAGVPVTGKIDKIELNGDRCTVVDYKTGDPDKSAAAKTSQPSERDPLGGDYWRQMVFYKLLIEHYADRSWIVENGIFDFVQPGGKTGEYKRIQVPVFKSDEEMVLQQLVDTYGRIMNHEFERGCGEEHCHWCNFAKRYELIVPEDELEATDQY